MTWASISNCLKTSVRAATTDSLTFDFAFAAGPTLSKSCDGSSYFTSLVSKSCSGRFSDFGASLSWVSSGVRGISTVNSWSNSSSSISSSLFQATTGDSNGGVSEISNSFSSRTGRLDQSQIERTLIRMPTFERGVAVIIKMPKKKRTMRSG